MTASLSARHPRIVCHMAASLDGHIVVDGWPQPVAVAVRREHELVHASYEADGWICGRVTMEPFAKRTRSEVEVERQYSGSTAREDFRAPGDSTRSPSPSIRAAGSRGPPTISTGTTSSRSSRSVSPRNTPPPCASSASRTSSPENATLPRARDGEDR